MLGILWCRPRTPGHANGGRPCPWSTSAGAKTRIYLPKPSKAPFCVFAPWSPIRAIVVSALGLGCVSPQLLLISGHQGTCSVTVLGGLCVCTLYFYLFIYLFFFCFAAHRSSGYGSTSGPTFLPSPVRLPPHASTKGIGQHCEGRSAGQIKQEQDKIEHINE